MATIDQQGQVQLDPEAAKIVKALALTENGGKVPLNNPSAGQSGEMKSVFQFEPATWNAYSMEILGKKVPMTTENESLVTYGKVHNWLKQGYTKEQIASIWNSGKPDTYKSGGTGVNSSGVKYDVPGYVKKMTSYYDKLGGASVTSPSPMSATSQPSQPFQGGQQAPPASTGSAPLAQMPAGKAQKDSTLPQLAQKQAKQVRGV